MGRSCSQMAPKLRHRGAKLGRSWSQFVLLAEVPMLRPCWIETVQLDDFGPICKMHFLAACSVEGGPPQLKLRQSDRSVRLLPLLHYHASAPLAQAGFEARPTRQTRISKFGQRAGDHLRLLGLFQCFPGHCYDRVLCSL